MSNKSKLIRFVLILKFEIPLVILNLNCLCENSLYTFSPLPCFQTLENVGVNNLYHFQTMKKKYFVLRRDSAEVPARLEYYDSEKKFKANLAPKR